MSVDEAGAEIMNGNGRKDPGPALDRAPLDATEAAPLPIDPRAAASISAPEIQVAPGEVANASLSVTNLRDEPCAFALSLSGLESGWYGLPERVGPLAPGEQTHVPFHLSLPRGYPPCALLLSVEARPLAAEGDGARRVLPGRRTAGAVAAPRNGAGTGTQEERRSSGRHDLQVLVGDGATISARVDPMDVVGGRRGRFALVLRNRSGQSQQVHLQAVVPDQKLEVDFRPESPLLLPGRQLHVTGRIRAHRQVSGEKKRHPFAVQVQGRGTPVTAEGSFTSRPWLPGWAFKALVIGLVVALWAAVAIVGIRAFSNHLHRSAVAQSTLHQHHGNGSSSGTGSSSTGKSSTGSSSTGKKSTGKKSTGSGSGSTPSKTGSKPGVEVAGKVSGSAPGGVTVTLKPTSLVSTQVLGASGTSSGTLARAGVSYGRWPTALLAAAVRHRPGAAHTHGGHATRAPPKRATGAAQPEPMLVRALHHATQIPDGKVYGTQAAAAFFPGLVAAITPTLTTTTRPDGSFVFTGVAAPGTYLVSFTEPGYNTRKYIVQTSTGNNVTLDTALSPGTGSLSGTVTGPNGPVGGVSITVSDGSVTVTTVTPTTGKGVGTWSVSGLNTPDTYLVSASATGYGTQITSATLAASASLAGVNLKLEPGVGSITGTVSDGTSGQPVGDVTVTATDGSTTATATTSTVSPVGTYTLPNLAIPGTWTLTVSGQGWITQTQLVKLTGNSTVNASLTTSGANVVGVVSTSGSGLANVGLTLSNQTATFKTLSESVSPVGGFDFGQIPPGQYVLSATSFGYTTQSASVDVKAGETKTIDFTLPYVGQASVNTGTITGSVVNEFTGAPLPTVPVELDGKPTLQKTNGTGVYTINKVSPGLHEVTALGASQGFADAGVQVSVPEGATVTAPIISLPGLATISGVVLSAATGQPIPTPTVVLLNGTKPLGAPTTYASTSSGTYTIVDVPAGNYVLKVGPKTGTTLYDVSESSVSVAPGEALTDNISLTEGPTFQVKTYYQTTNGTLQPQPGVCVVVSRLTTTHGLVTPIAKLSTAQGGPVSFSALISADTYVATFALPSTTLSTAAACTSLTSAHTRATAPADEFVARPDNTAIYPAVLAPSHGNISVRLQFPYAIAGSGGSGVGITKDCPVRADTAVAATCTKVLPSYATATLPSVSVTGTTGYATQTNGTPGTPEITTVNLVPPPPGSTVWTYPTTGSVPKFVSTQVTLLVSDHAGQFETLKKVISLPGSGTSQLDELITAVPVPVNGTISPSTGVSVAVTPSALTPTNSTGVANNLSSTDHISAIEGTAGALKWSDPATGASGGAAQPGTYKITLSKPGYVSRTLSAVAIPLCTPGTCKGLTLPAATLTLQAQVTLVVIPKATTVPGTSLTLPKVTLYLGTGGHTAQVDQQTLVKTGATYKVTFTNALTPTAAGTYHFTITGPAIQTFTSGTLTLPSGGTLTVKPTLVDQGWLKGTVIGVLVPTNPTSTGASEVLSGATVTATSGTTCSSGATFSATTTNGTFLLVGTTGGLVPGTKYLLCASAAGFTTTASTLTSAVSKKNTANFTLTATKLSQQILLKGVGTGVIATVTATSAIGPTLSCTFTVGSTTPKTCSTATAKKTGAYTLFTFKIDPTTYSFTLAAPLYETTTLGPIPYTPGENPAIKTYTLTQQLVTVSGKVTVSATGRRSTNPIHTLPLTLTASTGKTYTTTTTSTGSYTFTTKVPVGSYSITVGDTYTTIAPISFSTGTTSKFVENFSVYAPSIPVQVTVTSKVAAASANGVTVKLAPANVGQATTACGTHKLLEKGLGSTESVVAVGSATSAIASFTSLVPDVYTVTFSGIGSGTDKPSPGTRKLVVCPSRATAPATTPAAASFTLGIGEISATVTLQTAPATLPQVKMSAGSGVKTSCTPVAGATTAASCTLHLLVNLTVTYTVTITASGYTSPPTTHVKLTAATPTKTLAAVTLSPNGVSGVKVNLKASSHPLVAAAVATATVTLKGAHNTYKATTNLSGVATFSTAVKPGKYTVAVTSPLSGVSHPLSEGHVTIKTAKQTYTVTMATHTASGTITLGAASGSAVTVTVRVDSVSCAKVTIASGTTTGAYTCVALPGSYTFTFSATGYTSATHLVTLKSSNATETVTLKVPTASGVTVTLSAPAGVPATSVKTVTITVTGPKTYTQKTNSSGVAAFSTAIDRGTYSVSFTPKLTGATSETAGTVDIASTTQTIPETIKASAVTGTITLATTPTSAVTVAVKVGAVTCTTVHIAKTVTTGTYTCHLPPGTYTLAFTATGGYTKKKTVTGVSVAATGTTTKNVTV